MGRETQYNSFHGRKSGDGSTYNPRDAMLVGLILNIKNGPLNTMNLRDDEVIYGFHDHEKTLSAEQVTEMTAREKPKLLAFLSSHYQRPIRDLSVYGGEVKFSGDNLDVLSVDSRSFKSNELQRYMFFERGIDPTVALWFLNAGYEDPVNVKYIKNGQIVIDADGEVILPENTLRDISGVESILRGYGIFTPDMTVEELEENIKNYCKNRIELLVELNDIPSMGSRLLNDATGIEYLEALSRYEDYSNRIKKSKLKRRRLPPMFVRTIVEDQGLRTEIVPAFYVFDEIPQDGIPRTLGKNLFFKQ